LNLAAILAKVQPGDTIQLATGDYPGVYNLRTPGVTIEPAPNAAPTFTGPAKLTTDKVAWLHIWPTAKGATVRNLLFWRGGDIATLFKAGWNDYGIVVEAPDVTITGCGLGGMAKGIHVKGKESTGGTITYNEIDPTIDSCIAIGTSYGVVRGLLIAWNKLSGSYREDGIQFMPNFDLTGDALEADVSNLGTIIYQNYIHDCNENAIDLKGAGLFVIDGNKFRRIAGSSNGAPDWNHRSNGTIIRGAHTSTGPGIIRNNDCQDCCSGFWLFAGWKVYNNTVQNNNWSPWDTWQGTGISQRGDLKGAALVNNLVSGHLKTNLELTDTSISRNNPTEPGAGVELTYCEGQRDTSELRVKDASYFTDWFGQSDLPLDVIYLGGQPYKVLGVDYGANALGLDSRTKWQDGDPIYWRSPEPVVGIQPEYKPVEPPTSPPGPSFPPTDPTTPPEPENPSPAPPTQPVTVSLNLTFDLSPAMAQGLREAVAAGTVRVNLVENYEAKIAEMQRLWAEAEKTLKLDEDSWGGWGDTFDEIFHGSGSAPADNRKYTVIS